MADDPQSSTFCNRSLGRRPNLVPWKLVVNDLPVCGESDRISTSAALYHYDPPPWSSLPPQSFSPDDSEPYAPAASCHTPQNPAALTTVATHVPDEPNLPKQHHPTTPTVFTGQLTFPVNSTDNPKGKVLLTVTADCDIYGYLDVTGANDPTIVREKIFSKLEISNEEQPHFCIYRTEIGSFDFGDAIDDERLMDMIEREGDALGSLKFLAQHSSATRLRPWTLPPNNDSPLVPYHETLCSPNQILSAGSNHDSRQFTSHVHSRESPMAKVHLGVTTDCSTYTFLDITGVKDSAIVRAMIFSKLQICDEDQPRFSIYRTEIGSFAFDDALQDEHLMDLIESEGDVKGFLTFLVQLSSAPTLPRPRTRAASHVPPALPYHDMFRSPNQSRSARFNHDSRLSVSEPNTQQTQPVLYPLDNGAYPAVAPPSSRNHLVPLPISAGPSVQADAAPNPMLVDPLLVTTAQYRQLPIHGQNSIAGSGYPTTTSAPTQGQGPLRVNQDAYSRATSAVDDIGASPHTHNSQYFDLQNLLNSDLLAIRSHMLTVLNNREKKKLFFEMCSADPVPVLNLLQTILDQGDLSKSDQSRFVRTLAHLVKLSACLPDCLMLSGVQRTGKDPVAGGGFADVWTGTFDYTPVAIKALRIYGHSHQEKALKDFAHEAIIWRLLRHPNILKFYGVFRGDDRLCLVSPWMDAGNVIKYLENNPEGDRLALLRDVVNGLAYLHDFQPAIVHGDLKGANIFVTPNFTACLGDFGLSRFRDSQESTLGATTGNTAGTLRWQAPELFDSLGDGGTARPSQESDIYSFGCVCLELMTGKPPFVEIRRDGAVMKAIMNKQTPQRPVVDLLKYGLDDDLWALMVTCWSHDPTQRPKKDIS